MDAKFISSSPGLQGCPKPDKPEHAFIGRSNVGKSSLINMLVEVREMARTSSSPGKTRLINHFVVENNWYLADLPGYGYAKVSKSERSGWPAMIMHFLANRRNLLNTFLLVDARHEPLSNDLEFIRWMGENQLPFCIVFTKCDKLNATRLAASVELYKATLLQEWDELPVMFTTSAEKGVGREPLLDFIRETNKVFAS